MEEVDVTSSGILFYRKNATQNNVQILMGLIKNLDGPKWTTLGGRKENNETDVETALREFFEETGGIFDVMYKEKNMKEILNRTMSILINNNRYRLYVIDVDEFRLNEYMNDISERFEKAMLNHENLPDCMKEMISVNWIKYTTLFNKMKVSKFVKYTISRNANIINFFNEIYIKLIVNHAMEKYQNSNVIVIKIYKNMLDQAKSYIERNGLNRCKIVVKEE